MKGEIIKKLLGFTVSFFPLTIILFVGLNIAIDNVSIRGNGGGEKSETALIITLCSVLLLSIVVPAFLWSNNKSMGKGALWGSVTFYLVVVFLLLYLISLGRG